MDTAQCARQAAGTGTPVLKQCSSNLEDTTDSGSSAIITEEDDEENWTPSDNVAYDLKAGGRHPVWGVRDEKVQFRNASPQFTCDASPLATTYATSSSSSSVSSGVFSRDDVIPRLKGLPTP